MVSRVDHRRTASWTRARLRGSSPSPAAGGRVLEVGAVPGVEMVVPVILVVPVVVVLPVLEMPVLVAPVWAGGVAAVCLLWSCKERMHRRVVARWRTVLILL